MINESDVVNLVAAAWTVTRPRSGVVKSSAGMPSEPITDALRETRALRLGNRKPVQFRPATFKVILF